MHIDPWTRICLTVIAAALALLALEPLVPEARAADELKCRIEGPLEVRSIGGTVKVEVDSAFSSPGSSSGSPLHVKVQD